MCLIMASTKAVVWALQPIVTKHSWELVVDVAYNSTRKGKWAALIIVTVSLIWGKNELKKPQRIDL